MSKFICARCGNCCRWSGYVHVSVHECEKIADFLNIDFDDFMEKFTRLTNDRRGLSLIEKENGACIFFHETEGCKIQEVKPGQCKAFPEKWNFHNYEKECKGVWEKEE